jgi:GTP-dependent phosphoenolpyruvate carboxykinase
LLYFVKVLKYYIEQGENYELTEAKIFVANWYRHGCWCCDW